MKKENVIDFVAYREQLLSKPQDKKIPVSNELETAIEQLIYRLRELGPIQRTN